MIKNVIQKQQLTSFIFHTYIPFYIVLWRTLYVWEEMFDLWNH
jgi:hypothetical protein